MFDEAEEGLLSHILSVMRLSKNAIRQAEDSLLQQFNQLAKGNEVA
jgi:hypothetical protein